MMEPFCYRFPTRARFRAMAAAEGLTITDEDGTQQLITDSHTHSLVEIGTLYSGGAYDPTTGAVITPPTAVAGWHVNTLGLAPEAWDQFLVVVNTVQYQFFGGPESAPDDATLAAMTT